MRKRYDRVTNAICAIDTQYEIDNQEEAAKEAGMQLIPAQKNELQIDCDSEEEYEITKARLAKMQQILPIVKSFATPSKSKGHYHVTIILPTEEFTPLERVALQFMLGSDTKRECINVLRILAKTEHPIAFFEPL